MPIETTPVESNIAPNIDADFVDADFVRWQQKLHHLEAEASYLAGTNEYPNWWHDDTERRSIIPRLKEDGADLNNISRYYELYSKERKLKSAINGYATYDNHPLKQVAHDLGEELVGRAFRAEPDTGPLHTAMLEDLTEVARETSGVLTPELHILRNAYGFKTITELLGIGGDEYSNSLGKLLRNDNPIRSMRFNEQEFKEEFTWADTQDAAQTWMSKAVGTITDMDAYEASDYVFSASRSSARISDNKDMISILDKFEHFGVERIRELAKFSGIYGLEAYSIEQLERMEALANKPDQVAAQLTEHDVAVVLVNRFGDHNGVMRDIAADFDDDTGRVLLFEILTMDDIYRHMITLRKIGIRPSTLVLAAHSVPGQFMVSDVREKDGASRKRDIATIAGRKLVQMLNDASDLDPGDYGYSMHGMKGAARLVEEYMQPSRAIDDADSDAGRKKIIFQACYAASETEVVDLDQDNNKSQFGLESTISQLGKDLIASGITTNVDIYGAPAGIQMHRTDFGVRYSGKPNSVGEARTPMHAERIRIENGQLLGKQEVNEIALHK